MTERRVREIGSTNTGPSKIPAKLEVNPLPFLSCHRPGIAVLVQGVWLQVTEIKTEPV